MVPTGFVSMDQTVSDINSSASLPETNEIASDTHSGLLGMGWGGVGGVGWVEWGLKWHFGKS